MEGFIQISHIIDRTADYPIVDVDWDEFVPIRRIDRILRFKSIDQLAKHFSAPLDVNQTIEGPIFCILDAERWLVVHCKNRKKMSLLIKGDLDPMRDLVHELRYHPNIGLSAGPYKQHFEQQQALESLHKKRKDGKGL